MKKNKVKRIALFIVMLTVFSISTIVYAGSDNFSTDPYKNPNGDVKGVDFLTKLMGMGVDVVRSVAAGMAIIGLIVIGIKYIYSSPEGRAGYKKVFMIYLLGMALLIGGEKFIEIIVKEAESIKFGG